MRYFKVKLVLLLSLFFLLFCCFFLKKQSEHKRKLSKKTFLVLKNRILGKFDYRKDSLFVKVKKEHSSKSLFLDSRVYKAFISMYEQAKKAGVVLKIVSGTRSFSEQKDIWERKWERYKNLKPKTRALEILKYSSMPSTSRHHWGTDIDINNLENSYFETVKGKKVYQWLQQNANNFGFYQVYTNKSKGRTGYNEERWHWSYLPIASRYLAYYNQYVTYKDITGFLGATLAKEIKIISDYVNGINPKLKIR